MNAVWRSRRARTFGRHLLVMAVAAAGMGAALWWREEWAPMHRWNRAAADTSFLLLAAAMALGPLARLWPKFAVLMAFRRELGIYCAVLALIHTVVVLDGWLEWNLLRLAGFAYHPQLGRYVMAEHGLGFGNLVGTAALLYVVWLALISNDVAVQVLGPKVWRHLQQGANLVWALALLHAVYFLFLHFLHFHRAVPAPNPAQLPLTAVVLAVQFLRWSASYATWRRGRHSNGSGGEGTRTGCERVAP